MATDYTGVASLRMDGAVHSYANGDRAVSHILIALTPPILLPARLPT